MLELDSRSPQEMIDAAVKLSGLVTKGLKSSLFKKKKEID